MQEDYYNRKHRDVRYIVGDWVLLSTQNLKVKGVPRKLQRRFCGPFKILKVIGTQAYQIELPTQWNIHNVFHVSLLKKWNASAVQESDEHIELEEPDVPGYSETEKILRWRWATHPGCRGRRSREFLVLWRGYPLEEAT